MRVLYYRLLLLLGLGLWILGMALSPRTDVSGSPIGVFGGLLIAVAVWTIGSSLADHFDLFGSHKQLIISSIGIACIVVFTGVRFAT